MPVVYVTVSWWELEIFTAALSYNTHKYRPCHCTQEDFRQLLSQTKTIKMSTTTFYHLQVIDPFLYTVNLKLVAHPQPARTVKLNVRPSLYFRARGNAPHPQRPTVLRARADPDAHTPHTHPTTMGGT